MTARPVGNRELESEDQSQKPRDRSSYHAWIAIARVKDGRGDTIIAGSWSVSKRDRWTAGSVTIDTAVAPEQALAILIRGGHIPLGTVPCRHFDGGRRLGGRSMNIWKVSEPAILANQRIVRVSL
jgi:hypothetical protein